MILEIMIKNFAKFRYFKASSRFVGLNGKFRKIQEISQFFAVEGKFRDSAHTVMNFCPLSGLSFCVEYHPKIMSF